MITINELSQFIDVCKYKSILCLDGDLPKQEFFEQTSLPIISADGATNKLMKMGIVPEAVVGDLDSISPEILRCVRYEKVIDQNYSDFQKVLRYMACHDLLPAIICGISGGHIDHIVNNVNIFMQTSDNVFITDDVVGYKIQGDCQYTFPIDTKISIIGMPECVITTQGLKWELRDFYTTYPGQNSCFNRVAKTPLSVQIKSGTALLMAYTNKVVDAGLIAI